MEVSHIKDFEHNPISDQLLESMEASKKIADSLAPILEQEEKLKRIAEGATAHIPNFEIPTLALDAISEPSPAMKAIAEQSKAMKLATSVGTAIDALQHSSTIQTLGELAIAANVPNYTFKNPLLEQASLGMTAMLQSFNNSAVELLADSVHGIISSFGSALTAAIHSPVMDWLQSIDISPMRSVLENLALESDILGRYKKFNQAYLTAMYECKWFPYAGWAADITMTAEISDILATSRGASKRREKRIDKVILDYYDKNEIKFIKRIWRESPCKTPFLTQGAAENKETDGMFVFSAAPYNCKLMMNSLHDWGRKSKAGGDFCRFCGKLYRTDGIFISSLQ